jgi:hypothetical protein
MSIISAVFNEKKKKFKQSDQLVYKKYVAGVVLYLNF